MDSNNVWYVDLSRRIRQIVAEEVSNGEYQYLKGRGHHGARKNFDEKYRPSLLFRPSCLPVQNKRNLNVGSTELILVLQGVALNDSVLEKGIHFDYKRNPFRLVIGERIRNGDFGDSIIDDFGKYFGFGKLQLYRGHYTQFVKRTLEIFDTNLYVFHNAIQDCSDEPSEKIHHISKVR